jgi:hypothetical protein
MSFGEYLELIRAGQEEEEEEEGEEDEVLDASSHLQTSFVLIVELKVDIGREPKHTCGVCSVWV